MQIIPFIKSHFDELKMRSVDKAVMSVFGPKLDEVMEAYAQMSEAFSAIHEGEVIAIAGVIPIWEGSGEAWMLAGDNVHKHPKKIASSIKQSLTSIVRKVGYHRVQTAVKADWPTAIRFIEWLEFEREGLMRSYINNTDWYMYARVNK